MARTVSISKKKLEVFKKNLSKFRNVKMYFQNNKYFFFIKTGKITRWFKKYLPTTSMSIVALIIPWMFEAMHVYFPLSSACTLLKCNVPFISEMWLGNSPSAYPSCN